MFRWLCLALAVATVTGFAWMINDLRIELKRSVTTLNESLPIILDNTKKGTETLVVLSQDIKQLRDLAGVSTQGRDTSLVGYADGVLDFIESLDAEIGIQKKVLGSGLKDVHSAKQWVVSARKEALWLTFRASSQEELLQRLCTNKFGSKWFIQFPGKPPVVLIDFVKANHRRTE